MNKYGKMDSSNIKSNLNDNAQSPNFVPRSSYTNQIMEILKNVARQKEETSKVLYIYV